MENNEEVLRITMRDLNESSLPDPKKVIKIELRGIAMFTKGNWTVTKWSSHKHLHISSDDKEAEYGSLIFIADCGNYAKEDGLPYNPDAEANAQLISSAPDLYYALVELLNQYLFESQIVDSPTIRKAMMAIAKADGKE
jgi:hypothetical protein